MSKDITVNVVFHKAEVNATTTLDDTETVTEYGIAASSLVEFRNRCMMMIDKAIEKFNEKDKKI